MLTGPDIGEENARRLAALLEMGLNLESAEDLDGVLARVVDNAVSLMEAERGFVLIRDPKTEILQVRAARAAGGGKPELDSAGRDLAQRALAARKPAKTDSVLCAPLKVGTDLQGVICVDHRARPSPFTEQDLVFFTVFAIQAQAAIDSGRAYWGLIDSLFRASEDFIVVCDKEGRITRANFGASRLTGFTQAELVSQKVEDLVVPTDRPEVRKLCKDTLESGAVSEAGLILGGGKGGKDVPMSVSSFVMRDHAGAAAGLCLIGRDLSDIKSLVERLTSANVRLRELNDMKSQFIGMLTHELRTPLSLVVGYTEMMLDDTKDSPSQRQKDYLQRILRAGDQLVDMIMEIMELTRIETGKFSLNLTGLDAGALLREVAGKFSLQAKEHNIRLELRVPPGLPILKADEAMLRRAFENLVSNGIKYNKAGGALTLSVEAGDGWTFSFRDEGIGISEEDQGRLFERFFRSPAVGGIPGKGLGLTVAKAILERHQGRITVTSVLGQGTTFQAILPAAPLAAAPLTSQ